MFRRLENRIVNTQQFDNPRQVYIRSTTIQQIERMKTERDKNSIRYGGKCPKMTKICSPGNVPWKNLTQFRSTNLHVGLPAGEKTAKIGRVLYEQIGPEVVQTGSSCGNRGHPRSLKIVPFDRRQNFLYFLFRNHICISRVILELRRKNEIAQNNKKLSYRRGTGRAMRSVSWNLANCHATVQKLFVRQDLNKSMLWSWRVTVGQCVINMCTQSWRDRVESLPLPYRCHKQTDYGTELWISLA